jgi:hypothetical protein
MPLAFPFTSILLIDYDIFIYLLTVVILVSFGGELDTEAPETGASNAGSPSLFPSLPRSSPAELRMASDSVDAYHIIHRARNISTHKNITIQHNYNLSVAIGVPDLDKV